MVQVQYINAMNQIDKNKFKRFEVATTAPDEDLKFVFNIQAQKNVGIAELKLLESVIKNQRQFPVACEDDDEGTVSLDKFGNKIDQICKENNKSKIERIELDHESVTDNLFIKPIISHSPKTRQHFKVWLKGEGDTLHPVSEKLDGYKKTELNNLRQAQDNNLKTESINAKQAQVYTPETELAREQKVQDDNSVAELTEVQQVQDGNVKTVFTILHQVQDGSKLTELTNAQQVQDGNQVTELTNVEKEQEDNYNTELANMYQKQDENLETKLTKFKQVREINLMTELTEAEQVQVEKSKTKLIKFKQVLDDDLITKSTKDRQVRDDNPNTELTKAQQVQYYNAKSQKTEFSYSKQGQDDNHKTELVGKVIQMKENSVETELTKASQVQYYTKTESAQVRQLHNDSSKLELTKKKQEQDGSPERQLGGMKRAVMDRQSTKQVSEELHHQGLKLLEITSE